MVYAKTFNENEAITVYLEDLESGNYFIKMFVDGRTITKRVIKR
ncbi:T9SS C-terminal target domain-containing protein [Winogradskyella sp. KYW1333]|jgi:hypothetical protein|nr:T9SS C-terminal target domain-containing protein [Winogradskyella sp. KYW1333]